LILLAENHTAIDRLFNEFRSIAKNRGADAEKAEIVRSVGAALSMHAAIEEDVFYPALREAGDADNKLDEAEIELATIRSLVSRLEEMEPADELYDATVSILAEYVRHHVKEEEGEFFLKAKKAELDLDSLGERMLERKRRLVETAAVEAAE
jgi:hypothetical protein